MLSRAPKVCGTDVHLKRTRDAVVGFIFTMQHQQLRGLTAWLTEKAERSILELLPLL